MNDPWSIRLDEGQLDEAWEAFIGQYRRLIFAAIRRYAQDYDDVMEIFAQVCEDLRENGLHRLRSYAIQPLHRARFSTWLVTVVHRLTIDWFRRRNGRRRQPAILGDLPPVQRSIFHLVFLNGHSHVATYEIIRSRDDPTITFRTFQAELRQLYRTVAQSGRSRRVPGPMPPWHWHDEPEQLPQDDAGERRAWLDQRLARLPPKDRVTIELYVMEQLPAGDIARIVRLPNAKAVYNRVYRTLAALRRQLEAEGFRREEF